MLISLLRRVTVLAVVAAIVGGVREAVLRHHERGFGTASGREP
ncbi:MAG: hypothetical protein AAGF02_03795 [Actinomycetota bacterium]